MKMGKFLTGKELVSPYFKLDMYFIELFNKHQNNPKLHILLVFGKNEKALGGGD